MGRKPNNPPETLDEMTRAMLERKASRSSESRLYSRSESLAAVDGKISQIVANAAEDFSRSQQMAGKLSLSDTDRIAAQIQQFLQACAATATLPTVTGLCRSCGFSYEAVRKWLLQHPEHPTADLFQRFKELCADILQDGGLTGVTNSIVSIFLLKACHNFKESLLIETGQPQHPLGAEPDPDEIAERYDLLENLQETN